MIAVVDNAIPERLLVRLHQAAIQLVLPDGPKVNDATALAEDLLVAGFDGPATTRVAGLYLDALQGEAEQPIRDMLAEHGINVPASGNGEYRPLTVAFGYWGLPLHTYAGIFYAASPAHDEQTELEQALWLLLEERDQETSPTKHPEIEERMRAVVRAHVQVP